jgi:hypothetical protein
MQEYKVTIDGKGTQRWYNEDDQLHRENDKPALVYKNGNQFWFKNGKRHRENGPAVIYHNGSQYWYLKGRRHRDGDLPAVIYTDGREEYWVNGVKRSNPNDVKELTVAEIEVLLGHRVKVVK